MGSIAPSAYRVQTDSAVGLPGLEPSAYGGVLLLAQSLASLGGAVRLMSGIRWQGRAGPLLLFALVVWPVGGHLGTCRLRALCQDRGPLAAALGLGHGGDAATFDPLRG